MVLDRALRRAARAGAAAASVAVLSACSAFSGPAPETFNLSAPDAIPNGGSSSAQLLIPEPSALATLDTNSIVVTVDQRYAYYPQSQWPDRLPVVVQARLIEAFENSERVRAVGRPGEGLSVDYTILADVRAFGFAADTGEAEVEIGIRVMNDRTGSILATRTFSARIPVAADEAGNVVAGINAAFDAVAAELVNWVLARI